MPGDGTIPCYVEVHDDGTVSLALAAISECIGCLTCYHHGREHVFIDIHKPEVRLLEVPW